MLKVIRFKLEELMKKRGYVDKHGRLQYRRLARDLGLSHVWVWRMGSNQKCNPSMETIDRICRHFRCGPGDLLVQRKN